jgi:polyisoprenoid-binding protein YceI
MSKSLLIILVALIGISVAIVFFGGSSSLSPEVTPTTTEITNEQEVATRDEEPLIAGALSPESFSVVPAGTYTVVPESSLLTWAGQKPLIAGYVNRGAIAVTDGTITVTDSSATGAFTIDMTTLSVRETPTKPGQESALEGHLKGAQWFDTNTYPSATFSITEVRPQAESERTLTYDVTGTLTMRGITNEISFPAIIYLDDQGQVVATADVTIDRTRWGVEAGSASFFDNLADNVIADDVAISFRLVAVE